MDACNKSLLNLIIQEITYFIHVRDTYATVTIHQPEGDGNYARNVSITMNQGNDSAKDGPEVYQQPETTPHFIYLEIQEQPALSAPITDQKLQKAVSPIPSVI